MNKIINLFNSDWIELIIEKYKSISSVNKKTFWIIFLALNLIFLFASPFFFWGDHDWHTMKDGVSWGHFYWNGRYFATAFKMLFLKGQILPFLNNTLGFLGLSLGAIAIMEYWNCKKEIIPRALAGLALTCTPFVLAWISFSFHTVENLFAPLFVALGLILSLKSASCSLFKNIMMNIFAVFCFVFALGVYPALIVTIATLFMGRILIETIEWDLKKETFKQRFFKFKNSIITITLGMIINRLIVFCMIKAGLTNEMTNTESAGLKEIIGNLIPAFKASFAQLFSYKCNGMTNSITIWFIVLLAALIILGLYKVITCKTRTKKDFLHYILIVTTFIFTLFATKLAAVLSYTDNVFFCARIDFYGLMFFRGLIIILLFNYGTQFIKNITYVACCFVLWFSLVNNLACIKAFKLAFDTNIMRTNRLIHILNNTKGFQADKKYKLIIIGLPDALPNAPIHNHLSYKFRRINTGNNILPDDAIIPGWDPFFCVRFFYGQDIYDDLFIYPVINPDALNSLTREDALKISKVINELKANPPPSDKCIKITDNILIVAYNQAALDSFKQDLPQIIKGEFKTDRQDFYSIDKKDAKHEKAN